MAEQVQAVLDRMVPALRDLMEKEVFTQTEIKAIVSRRREYEYLLRRRSSRKSDYLVYIDAEKNLESLRSLRLKKVLARRAAKEREENKSSNEGAKTLKPFKAHSIGDASIIQHIHLLYVRAKRKWKQDMSFHIQHAEFAKEKQSNNMLGKIYAEALQIHPRNTSLWIEAASHEYFGYVTDKITGEMAAGGSIKSARVLMQRGLRVNPTSKDLWLQSFCLELHFIQKLRGRRELLQLGLKKSKIVDASESEEDEKSPVESLYEGAKLPRIIFMNAIKMIPNDVVFRMKFVNNCHMFPQTNVIVDEIMTSVEKDFGEVEEAWIARARFAIEDSNDTYSNFITLSEEVKKGNKTSNKRKLDEIESTRLLRSDPLQILNEAIDSIATPKMFIEVISFAKVFINHLCSDSDLSHSTKRQIRNVGLFMKNTVGKAIERGVISPELAVECTGILIELGSPTKALTYIEEVMSSNDECRKCSGCWLKYADIKATVIGDPSVSCKILRRALNLIPFHDKGHRVLISKLFIDLIMLSSTESSPRREKELVSLYDKVLLTSHQKDFPEDAASVPLLTQTYMKYMTSKGDVQSARKIYSKLLFTSNYSKIPDKSEQEIADMKVLFDRCITIEKVALKYADEDTKLNKLLRGRLYDAGFDFFIQCGYGGIADKFVRMKNKEISAVPHLKM